MSDPPGDPKPTYQAKISVPTAVWKAAGDRLKEIGEIDRTAAARLLYERLAEDPVQTLAFLRGYRPQVRARKPTVKGGEDG